MRLSLCLLLVILAVCCFDANTAEVCKAVKRESTAFIVANEEILKKELERYGAPEEAVEAKLQVKRCVDEKLSASQKINVSFVLAQILLRCRLKP
ncbi:hypothetical protein STEG23_031821 [Scotinomys teguina]